MKSQSIILLLFPLTLALIPTNEQNRLKKREITEYDLSKFIVNSCSEEKIDPMVENLCDQTLQSALMGNFPSLIAYCRILGAEQRYCLSINEQTSHLDIQKATDLPTARQHRKLIKKLQKKNDQDLETEMIFEICLNNEEKTSVEIDHLCNETLLLIEEGNYSTMKSLCKSHEDSPFCHSVNSLTSRRTGEENRRRKRRRRALLSPRNAPEHQLQID